MSGATDQRAGWLATLRRHDEVGVLVPDSYSFASDGCVCRIGVVESVTSGGSLTVSGRQHSPSGVAWVFDGVLRLIPADEARARIPLDEAHHDAIVALQLAALGLSEATRERSTRRLTAAAAQTLTVQIEALREALRLALRGAP